MTRAAGYVVFYGIAASASVLLLTATLVVLRSERPRTNGVAFLTGFVIGTAIACGLGLVVGQAAVERIDSHETVEGVVALVLGVALVFAGLRGRHTPSSSRKKRRNPLLERLDHIEPGPALSVAGVLGFGGPKRLVLTLLAMAAISNASLGDVETVSLIALYAAIATLVVSVPVAIATLGGERSATRLRRAESWLETHAALLRTWLGLGLGGALVVDGLVRLFG